MTFDHEQEVLFLCQAAVIEYFRFARSTYGHDYEKQGILRIKSNSNTQGIWSNFNQTLNVTIKALQSNISRPDHIIYNKNRDMMKHFYNFRLLVVNIFHRISNF